MGDADHMTRITEEHLRELARTHKRVKHVAYNGHDLVFRRPTRVECQMHRSTTRESGAEEADEQLAAITIVQVDDVTDSTQVRASFQALLDDWPYMVHEKSVGGALAELTGVKQDAELKRSGSAMQPNGSPQPSTPRG